MVAAPAAAAADSYQPVVSTVVDAATDTVTADRLESKQDSDAYYEESGLSE
jgi:hypothetical protein